MKQIATKALAAQVRRLQQRADDLLGHDEFDAARSMLRAAVRFIGSGAKPASIERTRAMMFAIHVALHGANELPQPQHTELRDLERAFTRGEKSFEPRYLGPAPEDAPPWRDEVPGVWSGVADIVDQWMHENPKPRPVMTGQQPDPRML